jgi:hypothetical protein
MSSTGSEWIECRVPFAALRQQPVRDANFNLVKGSAHWDPARLRVVGFVATAPAAPRDLSPAFDVWVDDVRFYTCAGDACRGTCDAASPVWCPASGGQPAGCWPSGTECSSPPDVALTGVWGSGANDVWTVGISTTTWEGAAFHWNGSSWTRTFTEAAPPIWGISGNGANDVWAVADHGAVLRNDGTIWSTASNVAGTAGPLMALWANGASEMWAIGAAGKALHWNGTALSGHAPSAGPEWLLGVWGSGSTDVWNRCQGDHRSLERCHVVRVGQRHQG